VTYWDQFLHAATCLLYLWLEVKNSAQTETAQSDDKSKTLNWLLLAGIMSNSPCLFWNDINTGWFKKIDSISYVYISWTIHDMWMMYVTFERGGPEFSNTTARALVYTGELGTEWNKTNRMWNRCTSSHAYKS